MKKQQIRNAALAFGIGIFTLSGCKKENGNGVTDPVPGAHQLAKLEQDNGDNYLFSYNTTGSVSKITSKIAGVADTISFTYNTLKKINAAVTTDGPINFIYAGDQLASLEYFSTAVNSVVGYIQYTYQNNKVSSYTQYVKYQNNAVPYIKVVYTYNGDDVATEVTYLWSVAHNAFEIKETSTFEYDDKANPLAGNAELARAVFQFNSKHNPKKETVQNAQNAVTETDTYTYVYDAQGYPSIQTKSAVKPGQPTVSSQVKYTYKN
jgi:hypothetical protein